jgi:hypothetical protein
MRWHDAWGASQLFVSCDPALGVAAKLPGRRGHVVSYDPTPGVAVKLMLLGSRGHFVPYDPALRSLVRAHGLLSELTELCRSSVGLRSWFDWSATEKIECYGNVLLCM